MSATILLMSAAMAGAFAFTVTLWATGFGTITAQTQARLRSLRGTSPATASEETTTLSLRRRAGVTLAGFSVVSVNMAAKWTAALERAGLTLTAKEYLILRTGLGLALTFILLLLLPIPLLSLLGLPVGYFIVGSWVQRRITSRRKRLEAQLVELLQMMASGLRAGFGLIQAMEGSAEQLPEPLSLEVRRTLRDISIGSSVEDALEGLNKRVGSSDFDIVITAILIQRAVGGNLAEILDNVAHTMRERERIRGEIRTLTSA
jgi:tight adherence protein B